MPVDTVFGLDTGATFAVMHAISDERSFAATIAASFVSIGVLYILESVANAKTLRRRGPNAVRFASKAGASLAFLVAGANLMAASTVITGGGALMLVALVLCAVGDLFLVREETFIPGLFTFLAGHVSFSCSFVAGGVQLQAAAASLIIVLPVLVAVSAHLFPKVPREQLGMVRLYAYAISAMAVLAAGTCRPELFVGALLFIASDIGVGLGHFVRTTAVTRASVFLYYAAQALFAHSLIERPVTQSLKLLQADIDAISPTAPLGLRLDPTAA